MHSFRTEGVVYSLHLICSGVWLDGRGDQGHNRPIGLSCHLRKENRKTPPRARAGKAFPFIHLSLSLSGCWGQHIRGLAWCQSNNFWIWEAARFITVVSNRFTYLLISMLIDPSAMSRVLIEILDAVARKERFLLLN